VKKTKGVKRKSIAGSEMKLVVNRKTEISSETEETEVKTLHVVVNATSEPLLKVHFVYLLLHWSHSVSFRNAEVDHKLRCHVNCLLECRRQEMSGLFDGRQ
jgi:hypothetical protein